MAEKDAEFERLAVDSLLASTVKPKVERFLEEKREEIVERYGTDRPHIDDVRKRRYPTEPSKSSESADPIDLALELRDAIEAVERRSFVLSLAMFHIGGLLGHFELITGRRVVPIIYKENLLKEVISQKRKKQEANKREDLDEILGGPLALVLEAWKSGDERTHIQMAEWVLDEYPHLVEGIVKIKNPPHIRRKKSKDWTWEDKYHSAKRTVREEIKKLADKHGFGNRVFGREEVKKKT